MILRTFGASGKTLLRGFFFACMQLKSRETEGKGPVETIENARLFEQRGFR
jgi:hypothetical protein